MCGFWSIGKIFVYKHCFCYLNVQSVRQKELFVSPANRSLVGILITIGDVTDIFAIQRKTHGVYDKDFKTNQPSSRSSQNLKYHKTRSTLQRKVADF